MGGVALGACCMTGGWVVTPTGVLFHHVVFSAHFTPIGCFPIKIRIAKCSYDHNNC